MTFRDTLVGVANKEWQWFGKDLTRADKFIGPDGKTTFSKGTKTKPNPRKETVEPYNTKIGDYWLAVPTASYNRLVKNYAKAKGKLDGTVNIAWSAAFISYCMQKAGAGTSFPYETGHATWMVKAIRNWQDKKINAALVGYEPGKLPLQPGDLIGRPREAGVTYKNAVKKGWFLSHSDIVVEIDVAKRRAYVIGGNVGQSCSKSEVKIDKDGKLTDPGGWIVHIQNNINIDQDVAELNPLPKTMQVG